MNKNKKLTRRSFAALTSVTALGLTSKAKAGPVNSQTKIYKPADPSKVAAYAYKLYPGNACMYAALKAVVASASTKTDPLPYDMFKYGHKGCGGQGSLFGACTGAAAAIGYFIRDKKECDPVIAKLFKWYETSALPAFTPPDSSPRVTAVSGAILCHISVTKWCKAAQKNPFSKERKNRCARLTADTAAKTVELLNDYFSGSLSKKKAVMSNQSNSCAPCHIEDTKSKTLSKIPKANVKMDCAACHSDIHADGIKMPE